MQDVKGEILDFFTRLDSLFIPSAPGQRDYCQQFVELLVRFLVKMSVRRMGYSHLGTMEDVCWMYMIT